MRSSFNLSDVKARIFFKNNIKTTVVDALAPGDAKSQGISSNGTMSDKQALVIYG